MRSAHASINWHSSGSVCMLPQTDHYVIVASLSYYVAPVGRYGATSHLDKPFRERRKHRVDRRRRLGLPELYTSPRLKRGDTCWQQVAWRMNARGAQEALVRGWRMAGQPVCGLCVLRKRGRSEKPLARGVRTSFLDQLCSATCMSTEKGPHDVLFRATLEK